MSVTTCPFSGHKRAGWMWVCGYGSVCSGRGAGISIQATGSFNLPPKPQDVERQIQHKEMTLTPLLTSDWNNEPQSSGLPKGAGDAHWISCVRLTFASLLLLLLLLYPLLFLPRGTVLPFTVEYKNSKAIYRWCVELKERLRTTNAKHLLIRSCLLRIPPKTARRNIGTTNKKSTPRQCKAPI